MRLESRLEDFSQYLVITYNGKDSEKEYFIYIQASLVAQMVKEPACNAGDLGLIPGLGRSPGEGTSYPFQYYTVHRVPKCQTCLTFTFMLIFCSQNMICLCCFVLNLSWYFLSFLDLWFVVFKFGKFSAIQNLKYLFCSVLSGIPVTHVLYLLQ